MAATEFRHGWGGDRTARDRALREKREARQEELTHPYRNKKFGDGTLTAEEVEAELETFTRTTS